MDFLPKLVFNTHDLLDYGGVGFFEPSFDFLQVSLHYDFNIFLGLRKSGCSLQFFVLLFVQIIQFILFSS